MFVVDSLDIKIEEEGVEIEYIYKLTQEKFENIQVYGVEIEVKKYKNGNVVKIEKNEIEKISSMEEKTRKLLNILYNNIVSPIHLIDVSDEYLDQYFYAFEAV